MAAFRRRRLLLDLESLITAVPFLVSWMICAVAFAVRGGYLMAKADTAQKAIILDQLRKNQP